MAIDEFDAIGPRRAEAAGLEVAPVMRMVSGFIVVLVSWWAR
jgi:hypothetical protein